MGSTWWHIPKYCFDFYWDPTIDTQASLGGKMGGTAAEHHEESFKTSKAHQIVLLGVFNWPSA